MLDLGKMKATLVTVQAGTTIPGALDFNRRSPDTSEHGSVRTHIIFSSVLDLSLEGRVRREALVHRRNAVVIRRGAVKMQVDLR